MRARKGHEIAFCSQTFHKPYDLEAVLFDIADRGRDCHQPRANMTTDLAGA